MGDAAFVDRFDDAARFGAYLRIVREGDVGAGDEISAVPRPGGIALSELGRATRDVDAEFLERVAADDSVAQVWRDWARRQLARRPAQ
jgi:MOSC domain-containing protein YiiM